MRNAPAPITGGMMAPPADATASTAPANSGRYPVRFMSGIVYVPVPVTFATALPDNVPKSELDTTAASAGPPVTPRVRAVASEIIVSPAPELSRNAPNRTKMKIRLTITSRVIPKTPSCERYR
jgi:hypothetical protein